MEGRAELRALREDIVAESACAAARLVIHINPTITGLQRTPFGDLPAQVWERLPCHVRADAESTDVTAHVETEFLRERQAEIRTHNRVPPILRASGVPA